MSLQRWIAGLSLPVCLSCASDEGASSPDGSGGTCGADPNACATGGTASSSGGSVQGTGGATPGGGAPGGGGTSNAGGTTGSGGAATGAGGATPGAGGLSSGGTPGACDPGSTATAWATSCPAPASGCTEGAWTAPATGSNGHPLRHESDHFAIYYHPSDPDGTGPLRGLSTPLSADEAREALDTLEMIWAAYFGDTIAFPEPYCDSSTKWKAAVHFDDSYPLWGGGFRCGSADCMGLWVGRGAARDQWGLAHEFMHGLQSTTQAFPDCGGDGCWLFESHANWMPHQIFRDEVHCSEMLVNMPHLYYGSTRDRYCNWQLFEFLKDKHCHAAVNDMWAYDAPAGQRDPWQKLMLSRGWTIEQLNDLFGEWAMHNVTWDYRNPPSEGSTDQGATYRQSYGSIDDTEGSAAERRLRLTRLLPLDDGWAGTRRFMSPYYWAPQRWGYNVVRLEPEPGATSVHVSFRGVVQDGADSGWRWGLVATDAGVTTPRYSAMQSGADGELDFCVSPGEKLYLVVVATPTTYRKIVWDREADGPAYPSIHRYPYLVQLAGAWPQGFEGGQLGVCPSGTERHENGGGCAPGDTPQSVYVGPYARIVGGTVTGDARIEDQATIVNGTVSGGTVGALSLIGASRGRSFSVSGGATVQTTFYPLGWFGENQSASGTARVLGDVEFVASGVSSDVHYGFVDGNQGVTSVTDVTVAPPYVWR